MSLGQQVVDRDRVLVAVEVDDQPEDAGRPARRRGRGASHAPSQRASHGAAEAARPRIIRPVPPHRPLPKTPNFPALEQQVLERWRERDVFRESIRRRQGAEEFVFYEGPPTANGRPGSHHVLARVFKDIFPRYQTMLGKYVERKGGWDCHGLPVEIAVEQKLGFTLQGRHRALRHRRVQPAVPRVGVRVPRGLDGADRAHRLLGRPRAPVPHARPRLHRVGVVGAEDDVGARPAVRGPQGRALLRALRHGAVLARGRAGLRGRRGPVDLRDVPGHRARRPAARRRPAAGVDDDAVDGALARRARRRARPDLRAHRGRLRARRGARDRRCWARTRGSPSASTGADILGTRYEPPFDFIKTEEFGPKGHTVLPGDFVSADDGTGLVHTSISFGEDDYRLGQEQGIAVINPVRLDGTYDDRMGPYAGRWVKEADADIVEDLRDARAAAARRDLPARLPALLALRHAAALLRQAVVVHRHLEAARPPAGRQRDRRLAPGAHQARALRALAGEQRRLGDLARALLGHAAAGVALRERPRRVHRARSPSWRRSSGETLEDPHRPYVDAPSWDCAECGEPMRRVPEVIDVWFDSGCMPFAQHHAPFENEDVFEQRFPAELHLRGDRPDARLVLLADRGLDAAVRPLALRDRARASGTSPTPRARRCRSRWATSSCRGRSSTATAPTRSAGTS